MQFRFTRILLGLSAALLTLASIGCGGGSSSSQQQPPPPQNGTVNLMISDASTEDWATIGVKVLSIAVVPQGGGSPVTIYTAPTPAPTINLVQLDQLGEIIGNVSVPAGTYSGVIVNVSGNPSDILLTASESPQKGFLGTPGATIPASQIQVIGATGNVGSQTVNVKLNLDAPLVVTASQSNALDLEFDLAHPAFITAHFPAGGNGTPIWAVNFNGPIRHRRIFDIRRRILRHLYGSVNSVSADNTSITVQRVYPVYPPTNPETSIPGSLTQQILADAANGTLFYDVDAKTHSTIKDFSSVSGTLAGKFVRVAARYQVDGTLVAVRMWSSTSFNSVWISPEGHVTHVDTNNNVLTVLNESGKPVHLSVDEKTEFFFRTPHDAIADTTPIGTGTAFLANLVRGFKVHVSVVDPLATTLVAQTVDIEIARFDGTISGANTNSFTFTRDFFRSSDDYTITLPYISSSTPNGHDPQTGAAITGFKWWNFTFPTIVDSGNNAIPDFEAATNGAVNFGGTAGLFPAAGATYAKWNDTNAPNAWSAPWTVLEPTTVPLGTVAAGYSNGTFTFTVPNGTMAVPVTLSTTSGSAALVYQVDRTNGIVTISPVDITTSAGQTTITTNLIANTPVKVYGIPQANGTVKGYVVIYFTGVAPTPGV